MGCGTSFEGAFPDEGPVPGEKKNLQEHYSLGAKLGEGTSAQVYIARPRSKAKAAQGKCAVKVIPVVAPDSKAPVDRRRLRCARKEARLWLRLGSHPHCLSLIETFFDEVGKYSLVTERCACSLADWVRAGGFAGDRDLPDMFRQMLLGVTHVHGIGLVHRDIKPENILFGGSDRSVLKLADFGLTAEMPKLGLLKGIHGSAPYMSPEMLLGAGYDAKTDVWSMGALAYVVIYDDFVYTPPRTRTPADVMDATMMGSPATAWGQPRNGFEVPRGTEEFVKALLQRSPYRRHTSSEVLLLPFLKPGDDSSQTTSEKPAAPSVESHSRSSTSQARSTKKSPSSGGRSGFAPLLPEISEAAAAPRHKSRTTTSSTLGGQVTLASCHSTASAATSTAGSLPSISFFVPTADSLPPLGLAIPTNDSLPSMPRNSMSIDSLPLMTNVASNRSLPIVGLVGTLVGDTCKTELPGQLPDSHEEDADMLL